MKRFEITIKDFSFGGLDEETLISIFKDGRHSSKLMEHRIATELNLGVVKGDKNYDLISPNGLKYEVKAFTKNGCFFGPSMHIGDKGLTSRIRKEGGDQAVVEHTNKKHQELLDRTHNLMYVIYDLESFPSMQCVIVSGDDLINKYSKGKVHAKHRDAFFSKGGH